MDENIISLNYTNNKLILSGSNKNMEFISIDLKFDNGFQENIFSRKNNKTLFETVNHRRYANLKSLIKEKYSKNLNIKLGDFLYMLKESGDENYKLFLNEYGDLKYIFFRINRVEYREKKGLYAYMINNEVKYIGRCLDNFGNRINQGYGKIHPKNCYKDGQATNCHLNSLIAENKETISLWILPMDDDQKIKNIEEVLIKNYKPESALSG